MFNKEKITDWFDDVKDWLDENKAIIIGIIVTLLIVAAIIGIVAAAITQEYKRGVEKWNNGKCPDCGGKFELFAASEGSYVYVCDSCGHTISCIKAMR